MAALLLLGRMVYLTGRPFHANGRHARQLSNLDRWYERDEGERFGDYTIYRVKLRPSDR